MTDPLPTPRHVFWVRPDAVSDNVLAAAMLPHVRAAFPDAKLTVFCQDVAAELYQPCPFVDEIVTFNLARFERDASYREAMIHGLQARGADLCLNSVYSRSALTDFVSYATQAARRVAFVGGLENMPEDIREKNNRLYTDLIPNGPDQCPELVRHRAFLRGIGIDAPSLTLPQVWLTEDDERFAESLFAENGLVPQRTIALCAGTVPGARRYDRFGAALSRLCREESLAVVALGETHDLAANQVNLDGCNADVAVNLTGRTTLRQAAAILRRCRVSVGAENGLAQIACALQIPNVVLLGGGSFGRFLPYAPTTSAVSFPLECHGCNWSCHFATPHCVQDIEPSLIETAVRQTLRHTVDHPRVFVPTPSGRPARPGLPRWRWPEERLPARAVEIVEVGPSATANTTTRDLALTPAPLAVTPAPTPIRDYAQALALVRQGRIDDACAALEALLEQERICALVRNDLGSLCYQQGRRQEAIAHFERAVLLDPELVGAKKNLADLYMATGRHQDAIAMLQRAATLDPGDRELTTQLGLLTASIRPSAPR